MTSNIIGLSLGVLGAVLLIVSFCLEPASRINTVCFFCVAVTAIILHVMNIRTAIKNKRG